eukprot:scaffold13530_cov81-Skeletonema_dohrnii-CCMP3373.AAC.1
MCGGGMLSRKSMTGNVRGGERGDDCHNFLNRARPTVGHYLRCHKAMPTNPAKPKQTSQERRMNNQKQS